VPKCAVHSRVGDIGQAADLELGVDQAAVGDHACPREVAFASAIASRPPGRGFAAWGRSERGFQRLTAMCNRRTMAHGLSGGVCTRSKFWP
jgi:hypothetical protein